MCIANVLMTDSSWVKAVLYVVDSSKEGVENADKVAQADELRPSPHHALSIQIKVDPLSQRDHMWQAFKRNVHNTYV